MMHAALKEFASTVIKYIPINPLIYIMKNEPILWAASLLVALTRGDHFFEIEDRREIDDNLYVDIKELYSIADADTVYHHKMSLAARQMPSKTHTDREHQTAQ